MSKIYKSALLLSIILLSKMLSAQPFSNVSISNVSIINTATFDFSPTFYKDGIVFVSNNDVSGARKMMDKKINEKAMSLFIAHKDAKGKLSEPEPFAKELTSRVHEGPLTFEKDYKTVYLSRNDNRKRSGKARYAANYVDYMKIYTSTLGPKGWTKPKAMALNLRESDACHPALSPDGNQLYFSSNRAGGFGGMDLYVCEKVNGKWGKPINLGAKINSEKNEAFPYAHNDGKLYFSSDKEGGKGGYDIYCFDLFNKNTYKDPTTYFTADPLSIGAPFNTDKDDFGFILDADSKSGYFTSNRIGGAGGDDIYFFKMPVEEEKKKEEPKKEEITSKKPISIKVMDKITGLPVKGAEIVFMNTRAELPSENTQGTKSTSVQTNETGVANFDVFTTDNYFIKINQPGYTSQNVKYLKDENKNEITVVLDLEKPVAVVEKPIEIKPTKPVEATTVTTTITTTTTRTATTTNVKPIEKEEAVTGTVFQFENIYYDFDKANIRKDAATSLDVLVTTLKQHPEMYIELAAHTDSLGTSEYNDKLSARRAESAADYLIKRGIDPSRLKKVPYGKRKLLINTTHSNEKNRRTEVRIIQN
jgi:outer membrane protein OmpA-like peptidoglycan-associated protein